MTGREGTNHLTYLGCVNYFLASHHTLGQAQAYEHTTLKHSYFLIFLLSTHKNSRAGAEHAIRLSAVEHYTSSSGETNQYE